LPAKWTVRKNSVAADFADEREIKQEFENSLKA
jgi:hypothetical protein